MTTLDRPGFRTGFAVVALFTMLAGDAWRYSVGWVGFGVVVAGLAVVSVALLVRERHRWSVGALPYPLLAFLALATLSITWSFYPGATALAVVTTALTVTGALAIAVSLDWAAFTRALALALRTILGLSIVFELIVAVFVRAPVLPWVPAPGVDYAALEKIPKLLYWSRNELFEVFDGGKIQGIVGNSSLLGFLALLGLIVFAVQLAERSVGRAAGVVWLVVAGVTAAFTRSATITVALVVVALVLVAVLLLRRARTRRGRNAVYAGIGAVVVAAAASALFLREPLLAVLGKSDDLTGRLGIWENVAELASQRPAFGWGWISYWLPGIEPFDDLAFASGVRQLHAHNAWLDIWLQLGIAGLIVFGALVLSTLVRSWQLATDRPVLPTPVHGTAVPGRYTVGSLLPLLILTALLVQSVAESRLIIEYGLVLLTVLAVKTRNAEPQGLR